ncbi:unnamed protein product [Bemisia tabaci]|uniref:B-related factor 1 n=1 Tax=Bemisia tabaci TaxID=7038 RepID=A0A9P0A059_BEMTA|nr:unnamed protein product [Bemisia tabaci]
MSSSNKCKNCGSSDLEVDSARGDTVCTSCGTVLEDNIIVSEVQFEENAHGGTSALGQFVSSDSKGGCRGFGGSFHSGLSKESREITLQAAKKSISNLCQQLRLNQHCLETAFNFYKLALNRQFTRGRKSTHVTAACVYITCRLEGTPHLLIDLSDVLQICAFELGRTYLRLSNLLCINIPSMDPCLYVLRYANKLEFGDKTHEVSMTAMRLVTRMKKDSIHYGRRPSGLCGAALLMAGRLHDFSRSIGDIVKVVNVQEATLKKRLLEFAETPSSSLTLEEFMNVDLEEEQDPPSFRVAKLKDRDRLQKLEEQDEAYFSALQKEIDKQLELKRATTKKIPKALGAKVANLNLEETDTNKFVAESTLPVIDSCLQESETVETRKVVGIAPTLKNMKILPTVTTTKEVEKSKEQETVSEELLIDDLDDSELDGYILTEQEAKNKDHLWNKIHGAFLQEQKEKRERLEQENEGKPEKKRRKYKPRKTITPSNSAKEAIEKILQEKKISSKINYDVLKSLTAPSSQPATESETNQPVEVLEIEEPAAVTKVQRKKPVPKLVQDGPLRKRIKVEKDAETASPQDSKKEAVAEDTAAENDQEEEANEELEMEMEMELEDGDNEEPEPDGIVSLADMLSQRNGGDEDYYNDYDDY